MGKDRNDEEKELIGCIYTTLSDASGEIWKRWNNKELRKKVEDYLQEMPSPFGIEPRAVLARHVTAMNFEYLRFIELAEMVKLKPVNLEYITDKYVFENLTKRFLCKLPIARKNKSSFYYRDIINFEESEKKKICDIDTLWGENIVNFHHDILRRNSKEIEVCDISEWYCKKGSRARSYMKYYMALFICHGVLFENYLTCLDNDESEFTKKIVIPAIKEVEEYFGVKPLIVPLVPINEETELYWWSFPVQLQCIN